MSTAYVGRPLDRVDGPAKVTGKAKYAAEFNLPNIASAVVVTSTIANGHVTKLDTAAAQKAPGVLKIYTHENFPRLQAPKPASGAGKPGEKALPLQDNRVAYDGQIIALVVAETYQQAKYAAGLVRAHYAALAPTVTIREAEVSKGYQPETFFGKKLREERGNVTSALAAGGLTVHEATYTTPMEHHNPIEPPASISTWDGDQLTVYSATQGVVGSRDVIAELLGIDKKNVRVLSPFLGGGFGCKGFVWAHPVLTAVASRALKRPVRLVQTRQQMFTLNGHRSQTIQQVTLGANADGKLQVIRHLTTCHTSKVDEFVESAGLATQMLYPSPNLLVAHYLVPLNLSTPTPMRAPGEAPGMFALESAMDELSYALHLDPLELRVRNDTDTDPGTGKPFSSKNLAQCYRQAADSFGWSRRNPKPASTRSGRWLIGQGMATATYPGNRSQASARARIHADGRAEVESASQDIGTGTYTVMTQVAADALGLAPDRITFKLGDTSMPPGPGSGGSQTAASLGPAVREACLGLRCKLLELVASDSSPLAGRTGDEVDVADGRIFVRGNPSAGESYIDILKRHQLHHLEAEAGVVTQTDEKKGKQSSGGCPAMKDGLDANQDKDKHSFHSFGAMFCEVGVDADLGFVRVRRFVTCIDVGRILNHKTARSQAIGGIIYGIGMALLEHTVVDPHRGRYATRNLADYLVPTNADIPEIEVQFIDQPDLSMNVLGSRGLGEIGNTGVAAALANAVYHATGKRVRSLPITAEKLL